MQTWYLPGYIPGIEHISPHHNIPEIHLEVQGQVLSGSIPGPRFEGETPQLRRIE